MRSVPPQRAPKNWATISQAPVIRSRRPAERMGQKSVHASNILVRHQSLMPDTALLQRPPSRPAPMQQTSTHAWQTKQRPTSDKEAGCDSRVQLAAGAIVPCMTMIHESGVVKMSRRENTQRYNAAEQRAARDSLAGATPRGRGASTFTRGRLNSRPPGICSVQSPNHECGRRAHRQSRRS